MKEVKRKVLVMTVALMAVAMLAPPLVSTAQAWGCRRGPPQSFFVQLALSMPDYDYTFWPNDVNPKMVVTTWGNNVEDCEIVIGGDLHYYLHDNFEYDQKCAWFACGGEITLGPMGVWQGESNLWIITYEYDFSACSGGIDGILKMLFVYKDGETSIRSLWGTRDLRNVHVTATGILGPLGYTHEGTVTGWPE